MGWKSHCKKKKSKHTTPSNNSAQLFIYLHAYSAAQMPIRKYARAKRQTKQRQIKAKCIIFFPWRYGPNLGLGLPP
jgi:hypothetical protein